MKKKLSLLLAAAVTASVMLTSCGSASGETSSAPAGSGASTGPKDAVVTMAIISSWDTLNIYNTAGNYGSCVADQMFERMVTCTHDGKYLPRLADSWKMSDDHTSITFQMNKNAKWQDGQPVTAKDALFTLQAVTNQAFDNYYRSAFNILTGTDENGVCADPKSLGAEALDDNTLKLTFKTPKDLGTVLSSLCSYYYILPQHILDTGSYADINKSTFWSAPVGNGPFKFVKETAGEELELAANTDFYLGSPDFKTLIVKVVPASSLTAGLLNGDIDVVGSGSIPLSDWETIKAADNLVATAVPAYSYQYMQFNLSDSDKDFQSKEVRIAFDKAIDKQMIVDQLMKGEGQVSIGPMPEYHPYADKTLTGNKHDPAAAKKELTDAGFDFSKEYRLVVPQGNQVREQSALVIQQNLSDIGVKVKIETYDFPTLLEMMHKGNFDLGLLGGGSNIDPAESAVIVKPGSAQNYSLLTDPKWYSLAEKASSLVDQTERKAAFDAYQQALVEDQPYIWLYHQDNLWAHSSRLVSIPMDDFVWYNFEAWTWKLAD